MTNPLHLTADLINALGGELTLAGGDAPTRHLPVTKLLAELDNLPSAMDTFVGAMAAAQAQRWLNLLADTAAVPDGAELELDLAVPGGIVVRHGGRTLTIRLEVTSRNETMA